jgi:hypothetical protein
MNGLTGQGARRRGRSLPPSVRRRVFLFKLNGSDRAVRLLTFADDDEMADYHGFRLRGRPLRGGFVQGYRFARVGPGRRLMGEIHTNPAEVDLNVVGQATFQLFDFLHRNGHGDQSECTAVAGQIAAAVCRELKSLGVEVPPIRRVLSRVARTEVSVGEGRCVLFVFELGRREYSVRCSLEGDSGVSDPLARRTYPWIFTQVRLRPEELSVATVIQETHRAIALLRTVEPTGYSEGGAKVAGELVAGICAHLESRGFSVPVSIGAPAVLRLDDKWTPLRTY